MVRATTRRGRESERGAILIEAAMILPLMLFICVGIFEFGRAFQSWQIVTNASREGARIAVLPGSDNTKVTERVRTYLRDGALDKAAEAHVRIVRNVAVSIGSDTVNATRVTVEYPFSFMVLKPVATLIAGSAANPGEAFTMASSTTMRNE